jgi:hypothetical protein
LARFTSPSTIVRSSTRHLTLLAHALENFPLPCSLLALESDYLAKTRVVSQIRPLWIPLQNPPNSCMLVAHVYRQQRQGPIGIP